MTRALHTQPRRKTSESSKSFRTLRSEEANGRETAGGERESVGAGRTSDPDSRLRGLRGTFQAREIFYLLGYAGGRSFELGGSRVKIAYFLFF